MVKEKEIVLLNELPKSVYNYKKKNSFKTRFIKLLSFLCISEALATFFSLDMFISHLRMRLR